MYRYIGKFFILFYQLLVKKIAGYPVSVPNEYPAGYPFFRIAGYPAGQISGRISIQCIPSLKFNYVFIVFICGSLRKMKMRNDTLFLQGVHDTVELKLSKQ